MKIIYNNIIYNDRIIPSDEDRMFHLCRDYYLRVPATANHVLVQQIDGTINVYYQRWLQGANGPERAFGCNSFREELSKIVIKELNNLKPN